MTRTSFLPAIGFALLWFLLNAAPLPAEEGQEKPANQAKQPPSIPDEPRTVDPATLVPKQLAVPVTVNFTEASLREIGKWIEEKQKIPVLFDKAALEEEGIPLGEAVTDHLDNAPLYLLLNRLGSLGLAWYMEDNILHITTQVSADERLTTEPYNLADLLDAGYKLDDLSETVRNATAGPWEELGGAGGGMQWLGDVQFVRQTNQVHREIAGLLAALRKHGRQTFTLDPPQHIALRQKLEEEVDVKFQDAPLFRAIEELAEKSGADIRLDVQALREERIRDREPVSLVLTDRKLRTVLRVLLSDLGLTWILRDGVMWITSDVSANEHLKTAVYDVRDLCQDLNESKRLADAIVNQTSGPWEAMAGSGGTIVFAKSGTMVIRQTERSLHEVLNLLQTYRKALLASKRRDRDAVDPQEVVTRYYRMNAGIAQDLEALLPRLVGPDSWERELKPDAPALILKVTSGSELLDPQGRTSVHADAKGGDKAQSPGLVVAHAVLVIRQTRAAHDEIVKIIRRVEQGDPPPVDDSVGGGLGGGGFGGSFFSTP